MNKLTSFKKFRGFQGDSTPACADLSFLLFFHLTRRYLKWVSKQSVKGASVSYRCKIRLSVEADESKQAGREAAEGGCKPGNREAFGPQKKEAAALKTQETLETLEAWVRKALSHKQADKVCQSYS